MLNQLITTELKPFRRYKPEEMAEMVLQDLEKKNQEKEKEELLLKEIEKERDKISKEIIEDKTMEKSSMRQKAMTDIFAGKNAINNPTTVEVVDISTSDKYYTENKKFIGKIGTIEATLTENGDGTYYGTIQFPNEKYSTIFYKVKVKIIE